MAEELEEQRYDYGIVVGQGAELSQARGCVYQALRSKFPPGSNSRVPWRAFGELEIGRLREEFGLREEDFVTATCWQSGLWLPQPEQDLDGDTNSWPPFIADWAFFKRVDDSSGRAKYKIREEDETLRFDVPMPAGYPPRSREITKKADFVKHMRRKYKTKANAILNYLLSKFEEYERHSGGVGFTGYSVIYKVWNEAKDTEMTFEEMVQLLVGLGS